MIELGKIRHRGELVARLKNPSAYFLCGQRLIYNYVQELQPLHLHDNYTTELRVLDGFQHIPPKHIFFFGAIHELCKP